MRDLHSDAIRRDLFRVNGVSVYKRAYDVKYTGYRPEHYGLSAAVRNTNLTNLYETFKRHSVKPINAGSTVTGSVYLLPKRSVEPLTVQLKSPVDDATCSIRAFGRDAIPPIPPQEPGYHKHLDPLAVRILSTIYAYYYIDYWQNIPAFKTIFDCFKAEKEDRIDIDKPLWNQDTYFGRWRHFAFITDCRTVLVPREKLLAAKALCEDYKNGKEPDGTQRKDIIYAKKLKDSAFHPDSGELMHILGRMSFQLPGSVVLTAAMLTFYRSAIAVVGCQLVNQASNAFINYTNRNAMSDDAQDTDVIKQAFACATVASCTAALVFRKLLYKKGPIYARWVPFCAVVAGNMVNLPIMRQREIARGIPILASDAEASCIMKSRIAAIKGISECIVSRIVMAAPGLIAIPIFMHPLKRYCFYQVRPWIGLPIELCLSTGILLVMIPSALAIFPQLNSMKPELMKLYPAEYTEFEERVKGGVRPGRVHYNKGL